jgi:hypothetical protein
VSTLAAAAHAAPTKGCPSPRPAEPDPFAAYCDAVPDPTPSVGIAPRGRSHCAASGALQAAHGGFSESDLHTTDSSELDGLPVEARPRLVGHDTTATMPEAVPDPVRTVTPPKAQNVGSNLLSPCYDAVLGHTWAPDVIFGVSIAAVFVAASIGILR